MLTTTMPSSNRVVACGRLHDPDRSGPALLGEQMQDRPA
jgi:hypothetical protein